jgi:hypothetical protein
MEETWWLARVGSGPEDFAPRNVPVYTWASGWGMLELYISVALVADISNPIEWLVPVAPLMEGKDYAYTRAALPTSPKAPIPPGIRPLAPPSVVDMMLRIVKLRNSPIMPEPFSSGLLKIGKMRQHVEGVRFRKNIYLTTLMDADPFEFARVYRDMAERRRQNRVTSEEERVLLARLYRDFVFEIKTAMGVSEAKAEEILTKAQGFGIEKRPGRRSKEQKGRT